MEQYINLVWQNYTESRSENSDEEDNASDLLANNELHYQIPFWIGVTVISLLFLATIIGTIRYCIHTLCSSHTETEKVALMSPTSPCVSTNQHQKSKPLTHHLSDDNETVLSSPAQIRDYRSIILRHQQTKFDPDHHHYFSPNELRTPVSFRRKIHDIYVLPVSPALSSSSSSTITNTDETLKTNSNTMPIRSRRDISSSKAKMQTYSTFRGIENDCFTSSPQPKSRTLPRLSTGMLRRVPPPSQPPPLPPTIPSFQHQLSTVHSESEAITLHFHSIEENQVKKPAPPPVPCRSQKPSLLLEQSDQIGFRLSTEFSSPQNDYSEHAWPNPPESMFTSQLTPDIAMHTNNTLTFFHPHRSKS